MAGSKFTNLKAFSSVATASTLLVRHQESIESPRPVTTWGKHMQTHEIQTRPEQQRHKPPGAPGPAGRQACQSGTGYRRKRFFSGFFFLGFSGFSIFFDLADLVCLAVFLLKFFLFFFLVRIWASNQNIRRMWDEAKIIQEDGARCSLTPPRVMASV